jgi:ABC-type molybdate transport system permease subunit
MDKLRSTLKQFVRDWSVEVLSSLPLFLPPNRRQIYFFVIIGRRGAQFLLQAHEGCAFATFRARSA